MSEWVSVSERLPPDRMNVLLCEDADDGYAAWAVACLCTNDLHEPYWLTTAGPCQVRRFTHWRPLPLTPKQCAAHVPEVRK